MIAAITPAIEPIFGWTLVIGSLLILGATLLALGLGRAAGKTMPEMPADSPWLFDDTTFIDTPIYADLVRESSVLFAAEVLADLDELEVWHG